MTAMDTREILEVLRVDRLRTLAKRLGVAKSGLRKGVLVEDLARLVATNAALVLQFCTDDEKTVLAELAYNDGVLNTDVFRCKYGRPCPALRYYDYGTEISTLAVMVYAVDREELRLVPGVAETLRGLLGEPSPATLTTRTDVPEVCKPGDCDDERYIREIHVFPPERTMLAELRRMLSLVQAGKLAVAAKSKRPTDAATRRMAEALVAPDLQLEVPPDKIDRPWPPDKAGAVRAHAWGVILQQCGWCRAKGSKLELTRAGKGLLSGIGSADLKAGFFRMVKDDSFDELNRITNIRGQGGKGKRTMTPPSSRKAAIVCSMEEWPVGEWVCPPEAFRFATAGGEHFSVCRDNAWELYFVEKQYGSLGFDGTGDGLEIQYLRAFLMESLATLGLVDIAYVYPHGLWPELDQSWGIEDLDFCGRYDGLLYVRLNALGAYCLGLAQDYEAPQTEARKLLKVLPNLDVALVGEESPSPADVAMLELMARPAGQFVWKLDEGRILKYVESGGAVADLRAFLENGAENELPQTIDVFLAGVESKRHAVVGMREAILIEMADAVTAATIAHDTQAGKYCHLAGGRYLAVAKSSQRAFRGALRKMGYVLPQ